MKIPFFKKRELTTEEYDFIENTVLAQRSLAWIMNYFLKEKTPRWKQKKMLDYYCLLTKKDGDAQNV